MTRFGTMILAAGLAALSGTAMAATAHNSQAGAYGSTKNTCAPTPYFPAGGCASSAIRSLVDDVPPPPRERFRGSRRAAPLLDDE